ncbi:MAG: glycosyltransferase family 4 protein [Promethearchaeota archaeon]
MRRDKPVILIGSLTRENKTAVPIITKEFILGLSDKYKFIPFYSDRKYHNNRGTNLNLLNIYYFIRHFFQWLYKLIFYKPDIVHYPITSYWNLEKSIIFLVLGGIFKAKMIGHLHGGAFNKFWNDISGKRRKFATKFLNSLNHLVVLGKYWEAFMKKQIKADISVVYNPIDNYFENATKNSDIENRNNILFVGSVGKRKGVFDIVECANLLKNKIDFKINIVGPQETTDDIEKISNLIKKYNLKKYINLVGPLYGKQKINIFNNSAIFLFPSYNENFPLVIIEAASAGLAIITTPVGALPEFFEHNKSVIFIEPGNIDQISKAIVELINDDEKRILLGKAAREVFLSKLNRKKIFESLDQIYQKVLKNI